MLPYFSTMDAMVPLCKRRAGLKDWSRGGHGSSVTWGQQTDMMGCGPESWSAMEHCPVGMGGYDGMECPSSMAAFPDIYTGHDSSTRFVAALMATPYIEYYEFSLDRHFLESSAYPFVRNVAEFYASYAVHNASQPGRYDLLFTCAQEICMWRQDHNSQHVNHNSLIDLSHATMVLQKASEWSELLRVDSALRPRWAAVLAGLPDLPTTSDNASLAHGPAGVPLSNRTARRVWSESSYVNSKKQSVVAPFATNFQFPIVHFAAVHPCGLLGLHSNTLRPSQHETLLATAINTVWGDNERSFWHNVNGLCLSWPSATRVTNGSSPGHGRALLDRYESALNATMHSNFWPDMGGGGLEQAGATVAVDELLLQSHEGFLVLFPAWERGDSAASFKTLRARGAFLVSAAIDSSGAVLPGVEIHSEAGAVCRIVAPWPTGHLSVQTAAGTQVDVKPGNPVGRGVKTFSFDTLANETYRLSSFVSLKTDDDAKFASAAYVTGEGLDFIVGTSKSDGAATCEASTATLPNETIIFRAHTHGYYNYLNPALISVSDSVMLVFAEARKGIGGDHDAIDIAVRRSTDGGDSFGAQHTIVSRGNDSCLCIVPVLTPRTKDVLVIFECAHKCGTVQQHMSSIRSTDQGLSWSAPAEISNISYVYGGPGPANGIVTSTGRILITYQVTTRCPEDWSKRGFDGQTCVILSDDDGQSFAKGGCIPHFIGGSEGQVAELMQDGSILLASRLYGDQKQHIPTGCRHFSTSTDAGLTFSDVFVANDTYGKCLPDPDVFVAGGGIVGSAGCEASLLSLSNHGSKRVFFASPIDGGTKKPNSIEAGRINLTLFSADIGSAAEARTVKWETVAQVAPSQSEYSSMCLLNNDTLAIAFVDGRGTREQGPNCGMGCCGRQNNTIRMTKYAIKLVGQGVKMFSFDTVANETYRSFVPLKTDDDASYVTGEGDLGFIALLNTARMQWSSSSTEYQSVNLLFRGDWDGLMEGPTWGAWWTQNTYGPTMAALPFMEEVTWAALSHSMAWWFNSIGNGTSRGKGNARVGAPDGCLCDAAVPVAPGNGQGCWYKQGDGDVPQHDWTMEESLSAVVMQAEMLLVGRNTSAMAHFMPLFLRTCEMLEARRDQATGYTTFLTGPGSNLLAPSFGGGPNGTRSHLSGVSVTYTAALNRLIELAKMMGHPMLATLTHRRDLNLLGIERYLLTSGAESVVAGKARRYLVMSREPASGVLHGKLNASQHGYFEASPNHDAVFLRVVPDDVAEGIMALIDQLAPQLRPHTFIIPNTDAGGGVGYDDMLPNHYKNHTPTGIYTYGTWVNGGVWSTQDARAMMAYFRTGRQQLARASFERMLNVFSVDWKMDAPLTKFGDDTWAHEDTMCTYDAFGHAAAMLRGMFEYEYGATTLALIPAHPDNVTAIQQHFGVRWGPYRIYINATGVRSSGITGATINGEPLQAPHHLNASVLTLVFAALPPASAAAHAATVSDVSTASTPLYLAIAYKDVAPPLPPAPPPSPAPPPAPRPSPSIPAGFAMRLSAADLVHRGVKPNQPVISWATAVGSTDPSVVATAQPGEGGAPHLVVGPDGVAGVEFDGRRRTMMNGQLALNETSTIIAVVHDTGSPAMYSSIFVTDSCRGLAVTPEGCQEGDPKSPGPCVGSDLLRVVSIDWSGSNNLGAHNISNRRAVLAVTYSSNVATSSVDGCPEQRNPVHVGSGAVNSSLFHVGSRDNAGYDRYFKGHLHDLIVYARALTPSELQAATDELLARYKISAMKSCALPRPVPTLDCVALRSSCVHGKWPRGCGLNASESARLHNFLTLTGAHASTKTSVPYEMASTASKFMAGFERRCAGLNNGTLRPLLSVPAMEKSLADMLSAAGNWFEGLNNSLVNRYARSADPLAQKLVAAWNDA